MSWPGLQEAVLHLIHSCAQKTLTNGFMLTNFLRFRYPYTQENISGKISSLLNLDEGKEDRIRSGATFLLWNAANSGFTITILCVIKCLLCGYYVSKPWSDVWAIPRLEPIYFWKHIFKLIYHKIILITNIFTTLYDWGKKYKRYIWIFFLSFFSSIARLN